MEQDFELKHRLVGAAVLIFFGVLVLPWWLSPPVKNTSANTSDSNLSVDSSGVVKSEDEAVLGPDLLAALAAEQDVIGEGEESVYVSRITPLDEGESAISNAASPGENSKVEVAVTELKSAAETDVKPKVTKPKPAPVNTKPLQQAVEQTTLTQKTAADSLSIEVGWAVQVGVFTDQIGAGKVVDDLKTKGFNPKTSVVDTNKGPKTGTRVWLGPYEARVDAAKAKSKLTAKTGEPGFIRTYP